MIPLLVLIVLAWSYACVQAGRIWQMKQDERDDLSKRDEWANQYEMEQRHAS